jgi:hypothetical protein
VAKIFINGVPAGTLWTPPYKISIKNYLKPGKNSLEIQITNMWINRLTGDMNSTDGKKYCQTNIPYIQKDRTPTSDETFHIQRAGLIGPVLIENNPYANNK